MSKTCSVCISDVYSTVDCPKCGYACCKKCAETFLLSLPEITARCMVPDCKFVWDIEFLAKNFRKSFYETTLRAHRAQVIQRMEQSLLPLEQEEVAIKKKILDELEGIDEKIAKYSRKLKLYKQKSRDAREKLYALDHKIAEKVAPKFFGHCPQEDCKGFLDENFFCSLCENTACEKCRQKQHEEHEKCDKNILKNIRLMEKDTKNCPGCSIPIWKISGCSQMWCINCHTAFDWETLTVETGKIHNPHYYQWLRETKGNVPRDPDDHPGGLACGARAQPQVLQNKLESYGISEEIVDHVMRSYQISAHIRQVTMNRTIHYTTNSYKDLRQAYLLGKIDDKKWLVEIKRFEKLREKNACVTLVLQMFADTLDDLHRRIISAKNSQEIEDIIFEMNNLREYVMVHFEKLHKIFMNHMPVITENWNFRDVNLPRRLK